MGFFDNLSQTFPAALSQNGPLADALSWLSKSNPGHPFGGPLEAGPAQNSFAPTVLSPGDEAQFQKDMAQRPEYKAWSDSFQRRFGENPNLNDPQYDYRGAWQGGITPEPYGPDQNFPHWPSALPSGQMLKAPDHPTAWMEHFMQQYGVDPNLASPEVIDAGRKSGIVPQGWGR